MINARSHFRDSFQRLTGLVVCATENGEREKGLGLELGLEDFERTS
jgi:hypothetical protein